MVDDRASIKVSKHLHEFLNKRGKRGDTYEQIIWRLILTKSYDDETKQAIKEAKKNFEEFL